MFIVEQSKVRLKDRDAEVKKQLEVLEAITTGNILLIESILSKYSYPLKAIRTHDTKQNAFFFACHIKNNNDALKTFQFLLINEVSPFDLDINEQSCLFIACREGNNFIIDYFVEQCKMNINHIDISGGNCLFTAIRAGKVDTVRHLIEKGCDVNIQDKEGQHSLFCAVLMKNIDIVKLLVEKGSKVNLCDKKGESVVTVSERIREKAITEYLISKGGKRKKITLEEKLLKNEFLGRKKKKIEEEKTKDNHSQTNVLDITRYDSEYNQYVFCEMGDKGRPVKIDYDTFRKLLRKYPELKDMLKER